MTWIDWCIVIIPVSMILLIGYQSRNYVKGVTDFLSAGRICGRYVICVGDVATALSVIGLVSYVEMQYKTGFALSFWNLIMLPLGTIMGLTGYCTYRLRATNAMSLGQFLEMRYSRGLRIFAALLYSFSAILANMIIPAITARFFIYFLDLPAYFSIGGLKIQTFLFVVFLCLVIAVFIICMGGTLALIITDSIQGFLCYPLLLLLIIFVLVKFSWGGEIIPVMMDRVPKESFLNPFDVENMRDFNLFMVFYGILFAVFHRASWLGSGTTVAAKNPHEQKMAGILGTWRNSIVTIFYLLVSITLLTVLNHSNYAANAKTVRDDISKKAVHELYRSDPAAGTNLVQILTAIPEQRHHIGVDAPLSQTANLDTVYLQTAKKTMMSEDGGASKYQQFSTLYHQMMLSSNMREVLPPIFSGLFCLLMILAMISTDDTRIFGSAVGISQDVILPLMKKPLTPNAHIWMLRGVSIGVGIIFFFGSIFMSQLDYILMFVMMMTTIWLGGCGPVIIFGLYSRFGTTAGAWASLLGGMIFAVGGIVLQRNWSDSIYPMLVEYQLVGGLDSFLISVSTPFHPYIVWKIDPAKFPINAYELSFLNMTATLFLYCFVSWLTCKEPFNLDRMLHRGVYNIEGRSEPGMIWSCRHVFRKLLGITDDYTRGDKVIAWSVFLFSFGYQFLGAFVLVLLWNFFSPWPIRWWSVYFFITALLVPILISGVTLVWFGIGGIIDLKNLFRDLKNHAADPLDDGRVEGNISLADKAKLETIDRIRESHEKT